MKIPLSQSHRPEKAMMICLLCIFQVLFLFLCMCSCVFYNMKSSYTHSRSSDNVLFNFISLKLMRKKTKRKNYSRPGPLTVWFAASPHVCVAFLGDSGVLPHPKDGHVKSTGARACPRLRGCAGEWPCPGRASSLGGVLPGALSLAFGKKPFGKKFSSLFLFVFLKCVYSSH